MVKKKQSRYPQNSVGHLMTKPVTIFLENTTVGTAIKKIQKIPTKTVFTYLFVINKMKRLKGVVAIRQLLTVSKSKTLDQIMLKKPMYLSPSSNLGDAMKKTAAFQLPEYPVCKKDWELIGVVRGQKIFEGQTYELTAQFGQTVGVDKEERITTPLLQSIKFRMPWLQINLLTAFLAAFVVGIFQDTIDRIVLLAIFLPVLAGQSGNTGCQALAVAIRAITLGQIDPKKQVGVYIKEGMLGLVNGSSVGVAAGLAMYIVARFQGNEQALLLFIVVFVAMVASCVISSIAGAFLPIFLKRMGADPAASSSIFLTTATDIISMGSMLGLATVFVPAI